jgi:hypothetical protein
MLLRLPNKLALPVSLMVIGTGLSCTSSKSPPPTSPDKPVAAQTNEPEYLTDPTCCGLMTVGNQGIDSAWHSFTKDGRYRLARKDDFKSAARAFGSAEHPLNSIFAYCWGRIGYDRHQDRWHHLAAIVVDTHRTDDARFGLVIFSAPKDGDGTYQPYWLYRDRDLSRTVVWTGTGDLMVAEYRDDGSRDKSFIHWDRKRKQFVATASRPKPT